MAPNALKFTRTAASEGYRLTRKAGAVAWVSRCFLAVLLGVLLTAVAPALARQGIAQPGDGPTIGPASLPRLAPAVTRLLEADYLSDAERAAKRVFHGQWIEGDLEDPSLAAGAALAAGAWDHPSLRFAGAPALDRAEAAMLRGDLAEALSLVDAEMKPDPDAAPICARRLRAQSLELLGRFDEAAAVAEAGAAAASAAKAPSPEDMVEAVRCLAILARLRGPTNAGEGGDFHAMMAILDRIVNQVDRLYWPARLVQAELLYEKDNSPEAGKALQEVLSLNPACGHAWAMLGQLAVDSFSFESNERYAARLDELSEQFAAAPGAAAGSPWAAALRARAFLRLNDPDEASKSLDPALARYPRWREGLAVRCAIEAVRYGEGAQGGLARRLAEFDELSPGSPLALFEVGRSLSEARQYEQAAEYLEQAAQRLPTWPAPVIELGLLEVQSGRDHHALAALEKAAALDPFNIRAGNSLTLVKELQTYVTIEGEHYLVRHKPGPDAILAREMLVPLEKNYEAVTGTGPGGIDFEPPRKTVIDLMPDHEWFAVRIAGMPMIHTIAASTGPCIAMEAPRDGRRHLGAYDWVRVLRHEFTHTVTLARTHNRIPHWFTEAAAVYLELSPRDFDTCRLLAHALGEGDGEGGLFDMTEINTAFVRPKRPTDRQQAYAQGHWMYEFIIDEWGPRAPLDLMDLYATGQREEAAFQSVLGVSRDQFLDRFKLWAGGQVEQWGLALPADAPEIEELLLREALADPDRQEDLARRLEETAIGAGLFALGIEGPPAPWQIGLPEPTAKMAMRWLAEYPEHPDVLELAARLTLAENKDAVTDEIVPILERYAAARPVDPFPHQVLARYYLAGAEPAKAIEHLEHLDAREQKSAAYAVELARRFAALQDWTRAAASAERATQISPYSAQLRELAATVALKRSDFAAAERHIAALAELEPDVPKHKQRLEAVRKLAGER
jgi:tetratricopeptide (TPR) repeat protein